MRFKLFFCILIILLLPVAKAYSQEGILEFEDTLEFKNGWQEYMPDAYVLDDSTWVTVGMNVNMENLTVNILLRWLNDDGESLKEVEILHMPNPDTSSWLLPDFYNGSAIDESFIYVLADILFYPCLDTGSMVRSCRVLKIGKYDGLVEKDTVLCLDSIRVFRGIQTSSSEDSLYLFSTVGYVNENPKTHLSTMPKTLDSFIDYRVKGVPTTLYPMNIPGDSRMVAGSEKAFYIPNDNRQDIWYGKIVGDTIIKKVRQKYYDTHIFRRIRMLDDAELAIIGIGDLGTVYGESSVMLMRNDSLEWNFYDAFYQYVDDIVKIDDKYCILQVDLSGFDYKKIKIILHFIDHNGFPYDKKEFNVPWLNAYYSTFGQRVGDNYFISIPLHDNDMLQAYLDGDVSLTEAHWDYTKILKFKIHE